MSTNKLTISASLLNALAHDRRRVIAPWRAMVLWRRQAESVAPTMRRWQQAPQTSKDAERLLAKYAGPNSWQPLMTSPALWLVNAPYAPTQDPLLQELVMELNPFSALSHQSAMVFHGLTDVVERDLHLSYCPEAPAALAVGTFADDWRGLRPPAASRPKEAIGVPLHWHRVQPADWVGMAQFAAEGIPITVSTVERTLLDGLRAPQYCGGTTKVLLAWQNSVDSLGVSTLLDLTAQLDSPVMRLRVGFLLESLGFEDQRLADWASAAKRSGSNRLFPGPSYGARFSERWCLGINADLPWVGGDQ